ncbi:MAG: alanine racemase [Marmoricola sp.]|nr:alanine racemase [Marmoricola sp.]
MPLTLHVDGDRWRAHLRAVAERQPGLAPVCKGNGYGFGLGRLARKAQWLGVDTICVGTYAELPEVLPRFEGSVLVMTPWRPGTPDSDDPRVIHTVGRLEDLEALATRGLSSGRRPRVVLERLTSMRRHGFSASDLREAGRRVRTRGGVVLEGAAVHLPLAGAGGPGHLGEMERLLTDVVAAGLTELGERGRTVWVSHLSDTELQRLRADHPDLTLRPRTGTALWLGAPSAMSVRATVLDAHPVRRGDVYGYRGRSAPRAGTILVVAGGTSHGIGLEAPLGQQTLRARAASVARGGLDAAGLVRSPFTVTGKRRLFAEPPHMQASMLFLPAGSEVPAVGAEVEVRVRHTTTDVDEVEIS